MPRLVRCHAFTRLLAILVALLPAGPALAQTPVVGVPRLPGFPVRISAVEVLNKDPDLFGMVTDLAVRPDGSVCATDMGFHQVVCLDGNGRVLFKSGRQGQGPGEFQVPYRIAALPDGSLLALDIGIQRLSRLDPAGKYVQSWPVAMQFRQINAIRALSDRQVAIAGFAPTAGLSADSGVHVFTLGKELVHERSFGPLPAARSRDALEYWGSGRITGLRGGGVAYVRGIPNEVYLYPGGRQPARRLQVPVQVSPAPDDAFEISKTLTSESVSNSNKLVVATTQALPLSDAVLLLLRTGVRNGQLTETWWDAVDLRSGRLLRSARLPADFNVVDLTGLHPATGELYAAVRRQDDLRLVRVRFTLEPARP